MFATICKIQYIGRVLHKGEKMNQPKRYSFHFQSELHPEEIRWRYTDEADHAANVHKTFKPKVSDLIIESKLDRQLKTEIRRELLEDLLKQE
tara:strand:+ start:37 stop:312 length:276 start_codon:yes stop_codon:yes gene_type:complete